MTSYSELKQRLLDVNTDLRSVLQSALSVDGVTGPSLEMWQATTARIEKQLTEETIRVAVVGSIKSGKSTLTNALFGGDYVKRGAGVVTSIITRVRPDGQQRAQLQFKTWEEVNADMNQALILFASSESEVMDSPFDITRSRDRQELQKNLSRLGAEQLISEDARDPNAVLLIEYLKGYDRAKDFVSFEPATHIFEGDEFEKQKEFVGDESLAVYLKDVCLTLKAPEGFGGNLEIADCQGSDSPNPLHLAMIQDYLLQTQLIVYVLSSRTGLRQADIRFLTLIKKMGLSQNIVFVLNCDFSEHETLNDLTRLADRVKEELAMILTQPRVFAFSALYNLFCRLALGDQTRGLSRKDQHRLEHWREDTEMVAYSDRQTALFLEFVTTKTAMERFSLLLESNLERMAHIASGTQEWVRIGRNLLQHNDEKVREAFVEIDRRRKVCEQVTGVINDTLDGTTRKLKRDLGEDVDRFFDVKYGDVGQEIVGFIEHYRVSAEDYRQDLEESGFLPTLYRVFQALQQATNRFIAESINPKLVEFVTREEGKIEEVFGQVMGPYALMIRDAIDRYRQTLEQLGVERPGDEDYGSIRAPAIAVIKADGDIKIPRLASTMRYTARIKTEAVLRLGFYKTLKTARKLLKKPVAQGPDTAMRSLDESVRRIKDQMQDSINEHFMDYKENLKYQYIFKVVDAMSERLYENLKDHMMAFTGDLSDMKGIIKRERQAGGRMGEQFASMETALNDIMQKINDLKSNTTTDAGAWGTVAERRIYG
ncbi:MAG: dynamin family protein [Deltaproteobacteria bacterium]|nr:dynamin family protein [Deltaproteobacteria bacterium]